MNREDRKAALAAYKEKKTVAGIFAIRCGAAGQVWVGAAPNIDTVQNQHWFSARMGGHPCAALQRSWTTHGAAAFAFEVLERLKEEPSDYLRAAKLKERSAHWRQMLGAERV